MDIKNSPFVTGGVLPLDSPTYVKRPADDELFNSVLAGQFCYVVSPHHMGKSSLMLRTEKRLQQQGIRTATIDVSSIGADFEVEQLYLLLIKRLKLQLKLSIDPDLWWTKQASLAGAQRFVNFLHDVVLTEVQDPIVIFLDGVDTTLNPDFFAGFATAIGSIHEARATDALYTRLTFVLLGVVSATELAKPLGHSLFTVVKKIELHDFTWEEAQALQQSLLAACGEPGDAVFTRIFYWTNGHPYLTQKLCSAVVKMWDRHWNNERVDGLVERLFRSAAAQNEFNIQFVKDGISTSPQRGRLFGLYRQVYQGKTVAYDEQSLDQSWLRRIGLVRVEDGFLKVRNEIYRLVFNQEWIGINRPTKWFPYIAAGWVLLILGLVGVVSFYILQQQQRIAEAQVFIDSFNSATSADKRLDSLAGLFNLSGFEDQARRLFYEELSPADQRALFELADPQAVAEQLVTVVKGLYTDPHLVDSEQSDVLLAAMAQPLRQVTDSPSLGSIGLEMEISLWRRGREIFNTQDQYQKAVDAYNVAIRMNDRNPGTLFDRGRAYAALEQPSQALADFASVMQLDESWQPRVQQALLGDDQLYNALWGEAGSYQGLVALVPTPTETPTPTYTPTPTGTPPPTGTPTPTNTSTPPPPTTTAIATSTPIPVPVAGTPTSPAVLTTPTPAVPMGNFTLLAPLSIDEPTYGQTTFKWQWSGPLPPDFGFEVRVWREGAPPAGVHNAVLDNQNGNIKNLGNNTYSLGTNIKDAFGVKGQSGEYLWTVALVRISPEYADLGLQASPGRLLFAAPGSSGGGKGDEGGGGVGID